MITGAQGFIGGALWNHLRTRHSHLKLYGVDVKLPCPSPFLRVCDLSRKKKFKEILGEFKPDVIFHLAGGRPLDESRLWRANVLPTQTLLEAVYEMKDLRPCIVIPGSAAEYGKVQVPQRPISEVTQPRPAALYGFVKYVQTRSGLMYVRRGLDVRIARIFNILGYATPPTLALGNFAAQIVRIEKKEQPPFLKVGNLSGRRDFLDIEDVCSALWAVAQKGKRGEVYNVCSGRLLSLRLLLPKLLEHSKVKNIEIREEQKAPSETFDIVGSNAKIKRTTGWRPAVGIKQSLKNTLQSYRDK